MAPWQQVTENICDVTSLSFLKLEFNDDKTILIP
jgi:hypothetical protein